MANWTQPVDNRSQRDLATQYWRAFCNWTDLNRIEENQQFLADIFKITLSPAPKYNHYKGEFWFFSDRSRILNNTEALRQYAIANFHTDNEDWFYVLPVNSFETYQEFNSVENMLLRIYRSWKGRDIPDDEIYMPELIIDEEIGVL